MKITSVKVKKIEKENSKMKGIASIFLDDEIAIHDIRILEGNSGLYIAMPSRKKSTGEYKDIAHPLNQDVRTAFERAILTEYNNQE